MQLRQLKEAVQILTRMRERMAAALAAGQVGMLSTAIAGASCSLPVRYRATCSPAGATWPIAGGAAPRGPGGRSRPPHLCWVQMRGRAEAVARPGWAAVRRSTNFYLGTRDVEIPPGALVSVTFLENLSVVRGILNALASIAVMGQLKKTAGLLYAETVVVEKGCGYTLSV